MQDYVKIKQLLRLREIYFWPSSQEVKLTPLFYWDWGRRNTMWLDKSIEGQKELSEILTFEYRKKSNVVKAPQADRKKEVFNFSVVC